MHHAERIRNKEKSKRRHIGRLFFYRGYCSATYPYGRPHVAARHTTWPSNIPCYDTNRSTYNPYGRPHVAARHTTWPSDIPCYDTNRSTYNPYGRPHVAAQHTTWPSDIPCYDTNRVPCNPYGRPHVAARPNGGTMWPPAIPRGRPTYRVTIPTVQHTTRTGGHAGPPLRNRNPSHGIVL